MLSLAVLGCGSPSDRERITSIVREVGVNPASLCTRYATPEVLARAGGQAQCLRAARAPGARDPAVRVLRISVRGDTASAEIAGAGHNTLSFVRRRGEWRLSSAGV